MHLPIVIASGETKPWAKEPENAWVLRCLGLKPEDSGRWSLTGIGDKRVILANNTQGGEVVREIPCTRVFVLHSWCLQYPDDHDNGTAIVVCGPQGFLLQQKDDRHPSEACRGRYSLFGGSCGVGEYALTAARREVYEEIRDVNIADRIAASMEARAPLTLASVQWPGTYAVSWFVARAANADEFSAWKSSIMAPDGLGESNPAMLSVSEARRLVEEESRSPGRHFVASHHVLLKACMEG